LPPPQLTRQKPSARAPKAKDHRRVFLLRLPILRTNSPSIIATGHAAKVEGCGPAIGAAAELGAVVAMVRVVEAGPAPGVRLAGEKVQFEAAGNPLQANAMEEFRPLTGLTVMVNMAVWPALMVALTGEASMMKSPAGLPTTRVLLEVPGRSSASPVYSAETAKVPTEGGRKETGWVDEAEPMNAPSRR